MDCGVLDVAISGGPFVWDFGAVAPDQVYALQPKGATTFSVVVQVVGVTPCTVTVVPINCRRDGARGVYTPVRGSFRGNAVRLRRLCDGRVGNVEMALAELGRAFSQNE